MNDNCSYRILDRDDTVIATFRYAVDMEFFMGTEMTRPTYQMQYFIFGNQEWVNYVAV